MNVREGNIITLEEPKNFPITGYLKDHPHSSPLVFSWDEFSWSRVSSILDSSLLPIEAVKVT